MSDDDEAGELREGRHLAERDKAEQQHERRNERRKQNGARGAEQHDGAREQIGRCGAGECPLDHGLQQIFSKSRSQQIVEPEQQNRHRDERQHAGDRHRPHCRYPPQPHQHAEGGKKSAGRHEQEIAADAVGTDGAQCFDADDAEARDHREPAGDAAGRQRLLQDEPRQQHAA